MLEEYGDERFERLAGMSNGQFYDLRKSTTYQRRRTTFKKTRATAVSVGERRKPRPKGRPGFLRVDTVHQGDKDGEKGVYHVNFVDEVTQWEHVATVRAISERCLVPVLKELIEACPFKVRGFHADNGSGYINHRVVEMLKGLHVPEFTRSRARRSDDNALVESKNGNVIRRHFGYRHIPRLFASEVNAFARDTLSPFLNPQRRRDDLRLVPQDLRCQVSEGDPLPAQGPGPSPRSATAQPAPRAASAATPCWQ